MVETGNLARFIFIHKFCFIQQKGLFCSSEILELFQGLEKPQKGGCGRVRVAFVSLSLSLSYTHTHTHPLIHIHTHTHPHTSL